MIISLGEFDDELDDEYHTKELVEEEKVLIKLVEVENLSTVGYILDLTSNSLTRAYQHSNVL